jgi:protein-L-isoaspartate(D-aspartate) O-methyltransferase
MGVRLPDCRGLELAVLGQSGGREPSKAIPIGRVLGALALLFGIGALLACRAGHASDDSARSAEAQVRREELVRELASRVHSERVLAALRSVPRHLFVPDASLRDAYANEPLPIGHGQTISQPLVVGVMTEALALGGRERVLEVGTGSGYQAAVLSVLAAEVYTIEIVPELGQSSRKRLAELGYANVHVLIGDGYRGWPAHAPFDRILLTAAPPEVPAALFDQLTLGGILVAPVDSPPFGQRLLRYTKTKTGKKVDDLGWVTFVPMVPGDAARP